LKKNGAVNFADVEPMLKDDFGLDSFSAQEIKKLSEALDKDVGNVKSRLADTTAHDVKRRYVFAQAVKNVLNARAGIGWNTHSHTAMPTMTTAKGCGAEILKGMTDNTEIGIRLKRLVAGGR
jgi:alkaline phosphatase